MDNIKVVFGVVFCVALGVNLGVVFAVVLGIVLSVNLGVVLGVAFGVLLCLETPHPLLSPMRGILLPVALITTYCELTPILSLSPSLPSLIYSFIGLIYPDTLEESHAACCMLYGCYSDHDWL